MGCASSKTTCHNGRPIDVANLDDSVHLMASKQRGDYVPRAPHPLLESDNIEATCCPEQRSSNTVVERRSTQDLSVLTKSSHGGSKDTNSQKTSRSDITGSSSRTLSSAASLLTQADDVDHASDRDARQSRRSTRSSYASVVLVAAAG